ncbi:hypothetical protein V6N12_018834 [Hibiscus sabdariffa]|uniref:CCHC-type domain-containing protein n=1 Tax=Hibiscus sabdariffa TaxID=183260 RepID=A0ABR2A6M6_9ROSI
MPEMTASKGRGKGGVHGKGRGRCKGQSGQRQQYRNSIQCYNCGKYGHIQANCWYKDEKMNFAEEDENEEEEILSDDDLCVIKEKKVGKNCKSSYEREQHVSTRSFGCW